MFSLRDEKERPEIVATLTTFMRLGCPDGRPAYFELDDDHVIFVQGREIVTVGDIRNIQKYLRMSGFEGGKGRTETLMQQMPAAGNG